MSEKKKVVSEVNKIMTEAGFSFNIYEQRYELAPERWITLEGCIDLFTIHGESSLRMAIYHFKRTS